MDESFKTEKKDGCCKCNVNITVNCGSDEKEPCYDKNVKEQVFYKVGDKYYPEIPEKEKSECCKCNVYINVNCNDEKKPGSDKGLGQTCDTCHDKEKPECCGCNVHIQVNCGNEKKEWGFDK